MSQSVKKQHTAYASDIQPATGHIRVQLFSSRELNHAAFKYLLKAEDGFLLECIAHESPVDLDRLKQSQPDLVLIDMTLLPGKLPGPTQDMLVALCSFTSVIVLVDQIDALSLRTMMACGVHGYLLTSVSLNEFRQMIKVVLAGGRWLGEMTTQTSFASPAPSYAVGGAPIIRDLSQRELDILKKVASGKTSKEIAHTLCLSESSVRTYWYRVLTKLNALNKVEAIVRATQLGFLDLSSEADMLPLARGRVSTLRQKL